MSKSLYNGIVWSVAEVIVKRGLDFIVKLILARLLFPEDFGIIGMATVFTSFIRVLNEAGMGPAIVQKKELTNKYLSTIFWTNSIWSIVLFLVMSFFIAPLASNFYNQPILEKIIPVLSISLITGGLQVVSYSTLRKELQFKKIALIRNTSTLVAGFIAVTMAFSGFGIWALVANEVVAYIFAIPLFYNATKWKPLFFWDNKILKEILTYSLFITASQLIINFVSNADYLLIGKIIGSSALGAYTIAFMMTNMVSGQITSMFDTVMFPFYSSIQDNVEKIKEYFLKIISYYALILYPIMLSLFLFSKEIVVLIFGEKWLESIVPVKFLALSVMVSILTSGYHLLFRSLGKPKYEFKIQRITSLLIYLPCLIIGVYFYGTNGAAAGVFVSSVINFFIHQYVLNKYFNINTTTLLFQNVKLILLSLFLVFFVFLLKYLNINCYVILFCYSIIMMVSYYVFFKVKILGVLNRRRNE